MKKSRIFVLSVAVAAGTALAQDAPTGIVRSGAIGLLRAESKISIGTAPPVESITDNAVGGFQMVDYTNYPPPPAAQSTTIGPCIVVTTTIPQAPPPNTVVVTPLDAGPVINLNGPNGPQQLPQMKNAYFATLGGGTPLPSLPFPIPGLPGPKPLYLDPGTYTIDNGAGGADVGPFTATLNVPSALVWTNADSDLTIDRSAGVDIQWTGGDPANNVSIQGSVTIVDPATFKATGGAAFTCSVPNTGDFTVTPDVLSLLPASTTGGPPGSSLSVLTVDSLSLVNFSASGIDTGLFSYSSGSSRNVVYQ